MSRSSENNDALWQFVELGDYRVPSLPARSAAVDAWTSVKRTFGLVDKDGQAPFKQEGELRALTEARLEDLIRPLNWAEPAVALGVTLNDRLRTDGGGAPVTFVVGQPGCGHIEILRNWAARNGAASIVAPGYDQILREDTSWFDGWPVSDRTWVLPDLERCYLRHADGLSLVRHLLERAERGILGRGVIGCHSWAWAYLQRIWSMPRPDALTLQAFDGQRLARLFCALVMARAGTRICFRNAATGKAILTVPPVDDQVQADIVSLAAHCRGNVGTAVCHWRERLRSEPEEGKAGSDTSAGVSETGESEESFWVSAPLTVPVETDEDTLLLLHTLLLHGGLPGALVSTLLPISYHRSMALLLRSRTAGLVKYHGDHWHVTELAYPTVRSRLSVRDYLTDGF